MPDTPHTAVAHADDVGIDLALVRGLVGRQFPAWAGLPLTEVRSAGTDNRLYRLGDDMVVRLPRRRWVADRVAREHRWLPVLAPLLPLTVPVPLGAGRPDSAYPYPWSVYPWLDGDNAAEAPVADPVDAATRLGRFVAALRGADATGAPPASRGGPVTDLDADVQTRIGTPAQAAVWEAACAAPPWTGPPVWIHSDLSPANLVLRRGRLSAVIDFGGLGAGDPAADLVPAWNWLTAPARAVFRAASQVDDATWARGRGWALALGLGAAQTYRDTNPVVAAIGRHAIVETTREFEA